MAIQFTIDGKKVSGEKRQTILDVARANGIDIPALCHHGAVPSCGRCKLCVVEITQEGWGGESKIVTSCRYPAKEGLIVQTNSPQVRENRKTTLEMLTARAPGAELIKRLAREYGITKMMPAKGEKKERCIMCSLCVRLCVHQGVNVAPAGCGGQDKEIDTYWKEPPKECIGCMVCARNCPTDAVPFKEGKGAREIWNRKFKLVRCLGCKEFTRLTDEQVAFYSKATGLAADYFTKCAACRRAETTGTFLRIIEDPSAGTMKDWGMKPLSSHHMPEPTEEWKSLQKRKRKKKGMSLRAKRSNPE